MSAMSANTRSHTCWADCGVREQDCWSDSAGPEAGGAVPSDEGPDPQERSAPATGPRTESIEETMRFWRQVANMTSLGWSTVLPIVGGIMLGHYIDQRTGGKYVWTIGLLVGGIMIAFYNLYYILTKEMNE